MSGDSIGLAIQLALSTNEDEEARALARELFDRLLTTPQMLEAPAPVSVLACYMLMTTITDAFVVYHIEGEEEKVDN